MKAAFIERHGGRDALRIGDLPVPEPGPGEVRVRVVAAALNHLDLFVRRGIPGIELEMPHTLGADGAGVVDAAGPGVDAFTPGEAVTIQPGLFCGECEFCLAGEESLCFRYRLLGEHVAGTFAEFVNVPAVNLYPKPDALSWQVAAAFPLAYQTAWRLVMNAGALEPGQTVLIHGVGGGVAAAALQIAKRTGAFVYVTSSSRAKLERASELGADVGIDYRNESVSKRIREETNKRGVDLVIDNVGKETWPDSMECVRRGGRIASCGATTGSDAILPINRLFWKQFSIHGSTMANRAEFAQISRLVERGEIEPVVDRVFPLDDAGAALKRLESNEGFGKIVLNIGHS